MRNEETRYLISLESNIESLKKEIEISDLSDFEFGILLGKKSVYESLLGIYHLKKSRENANIQQLINF